MAYDRTRGMGLFPHDPFPTIEVDSRPSAELAETARDVNQSERPRDQAIWTLVSRNESNIDGLLMSLAHDDPNPDIQRSAAWALFRRANLDALRESVSVNDSARVSVWKRHLIAEALGSAEPFDDRAVRSVEGATFDYSMPLDVQGTIQFKGQDGSWYRMPVSPAARACLVGQMTAFVNLDTFETELVIQKRIRDIMESGTDYVEGYKFHGLSRPTGLNSVTHYYEALWEHDFFPAGRTGDDSDGIIRNVKTHLYRTAETDVRLTETGVPYPQSVRGIFHGTVFMNSAVLHDPQLPWDGLLQIVSKTDPEAGKYVNGWFYGTFRGILDDVDDDGVLELNGIRSFVGPDGEVLEQRPAASTVS